jgi:hypothetical protein
MNATADLLRAATLDLPPVSTEVATTLPVRAEVAFEVFADAGETPRWLSVVQSARVMSRTPDGRPLQVSFHANFERATLGYRVTYDYRPRSSRCAGRPMTAAPSGSMARPGSRPCPPAPA